MRIVVLMGGKSSEREISLRTGKAVAEGLQKLGHEVITLDITEDTPCRLKELKPDKVFIALHGKYGEDGTVQGMLELLGIPYTGSGVLTSAMCIRKDITKKILEYHGIKTPAWKIIKTQKDIENWEIFPSIIKPLDEGSSINVCKVQSKEEAKSVIDSALKENKKLLIEKFIDGYDVTVGLLKGELLPPIVIKPKGELYDYESKYTKGKTEYIFLENKELTKRLYEISSEINDIFELKDMARIDFRVDKEGEAYVLEINTIPGMTETSLLPMACKKVGIDFQELLHIIIS